MSFYDKGEAFHFEDDLQREADAQWIDSKRFRVYPDQDEKESERGDL